MVCAGSHDSGLMGRQGAAGSSWPKVCGQLIIAAVCGLYSEWGGRCLGVVSYMKMTSGSLWLQLSINLCGCWMMLQLDRHLKLQTSLLLLWAELWSEHHLIQSDMIKVISWCGDISVTLILNMKWKHESTVTLRPNCNTEVHSWFLSVKIFHIKAFWRCINDFIVMCCSYIQHSSSEPKHHRCNRNTLLRV